MTDSEHILWAMHTCANGVRWKASVQQFEVNKLRWAATLQHELDSGIYHTRGFKRFDIMERGKLRHIQSVHISERTVQKLLCEYALKPTIYPRLIYDNSASQQGKGTDFALKRLVEHLRWHYARYGKNGTIVVMDYHNFFGSIPHAGAIDEMAAHISDDRIRHYIAHFVDAFDGDFGLGLGSETSQIGAISYPNPIDRLVKEKYGVHCYARYMDDSYIIHPDRGYVLECLAEVKEVAARLGIEVHDTKTVIHNMKSDDFVFLKKRVHITDTGKVILRLTRQNVQEERERILLMKQEYEAGRIPKESIRQSYQSWRGYARKYHAYHTVESMDKFFNSVMAGII